ncbi:MAG: 3'-5' exoribonuclease [Nostoc sp.]|uniref:3'-5' exoribonuclease domain-containing protein n=1 Tax=Nostoc sp. TaxID=1180 RepID=UPI002FFA9F5F
MRFFLDTEFVETGSTIDLISIGIVAEDGREFYAINDNCDFDKANDWVKKNVISALPPRTDRVWKPKDAIAFEVMAFIKHDEGHELYHHTFNSLKNATMPERPEFWGEWCAYDWVIFCWLFGEMSRLPNGFPMRCNDIIQFAETHLGVPASKLPPSLETDGNHNALLGARTVKQRWEWLQFQCSGVA